MKRSYLVYILIAGISLFILSLTAIVEEIFYYAFDEKIPLVIKLNSILVKYVKGTEKMQIIESIIRLTNDYNIKWHDPLIVEISASSQKSADELADKLKQEETVYSCQPFYTLIDGLDMGVTDEILVRFLSEVTEVHQKELQKSYSRRANFRR